MVARTEKIRPGVEVDLVIICDEALYPRFFFAEKGEGRGRGVPGRRSLQRFITAVHPVSFINCIRTGSNL